MVNQVGFDPNEHRSQCEAYLGYFLGEPFVFERMRIAHTPEV